MAAARELASLYTRTRLFVNAFQPSFELAEKERDGVRVRKRYHPPATPCDQLLSDQRKFDEVRRRVEAVRVDLDPAQLLAEMPRCTTSPMNLHLTEIASAVAPGAHAVLVLDQAGWHMTKKLVIPTNVTLLPLQARSPELNPVENLWQFIRENWLGHRIFALYEAVLDHCCDAWNKLIDQPWRIISIGLRAWANKF